MKATMMLYKIQHDVQHVTERMVHQKCNLRVTFPFQNPSPTLFQSLVRRGGPAKGGTGTAPKADLWKTLWITLWTPVLWTDFHRKRVGKFPTQARLVVLVGQLAWDHP
jgi:hypothetical protein